MIINHLKLSLRTFRKNGVYTLINILGLVIGISASLLLFRIVKYESGFNKNFKNHDQIVRVIHEEHSPDGQVKYTTCTPIPAMDIMENTVTQFSKMSRIREMWSNITIPGESGNIPDRKFAIEHDEVSFFVENEFFDIFDLTWLAGEKNTALTNPGTIVMTKEWAEKCFDSWENALNRTVLIDNLIPAKVEGVINNLPSNCDFPIQYLVSYETLKSNPDLFFFSGADNWGSCSSNNQVYALIPPDADREAINVTLSKVGAKEYSERNNGVQGRIHMIQPLSDLHYNEDLGHSGTHHMSRSRIKVLSMIGILILVIACFNFVNLATAQASLRMKEVGIRKTLGGQRIQLIGQFILETALLVFVSILMGVVLADLTTPLLSFVSHIPTDTSLFSDLSILGILLVIFIGVSLLSGLYPSLILSGFKPVRALQKNAKSSHQSGWPLRKSLIVLQFSIAQVLIISAIITIVQMEYIRSKDLGFSNDLVYTFTFNDDSTTVARQAALKHRLKQVPGVRSVSFSSDQPLSGNTWFTNFRFGDRPEDESFPVSIKFCDEDYLDTYGLELLAGKWYSKSDTMRDAVINETLLRKLGISDPEEVIGQNIRMGGYRKMKITGVSRDFHTHSLRSAHLPLMMTTRKRYYWEAGLKLNPDDVVTTTGNIRAAFDDVLPEQVFHGNFLDERIARYYEDDKRMSNTTKAFGFLAVLISCLGLFGLATHAATQRVKEIGIRKVLGSSVSGIIGLLSYDFIKLVLLAFVVAVPISYYFMQKWLQDFVYRIEITWWIFAMTGLITILLAFLTVSYQSVRAAFANPVDALRSE